ncbi:PRP38-domain-containing protein [Hyphopichia burtonii NRRL Y-1933]|uniref:Pre-mRNA-splicing factor 38 n=1 Tax=Hyphopichia burtonii NRRL Y-1933 TaxID=984485 RepID=A0A1E4RDT0_9ASCO|nr:PRP38-domain-containing protein [Hyphopichia burtonii NRRL Y-1933]ODV65401.1 PRP38-domain-containing protein [Hyphopichia burtonii NRRL Y-1933]
MSEQPGYNDKRTVLNKASLIEPIIRHRIQDSTFYKQYLYLTNELTILPIITNHVKYIGGTDSIGRPLEFLCCSLRLLELDPPKEIISIYLNQYGYNEFKYLTGLILFYIRLSYSSQEIYTVFDEYLKDYRKLRFKLKTPKFLDNGLSVNFAIIHMDEWVDQLLTNERCIDLILPRLINRSLLVDRDLIDPRHYPVTKHPNDSPSDATSSDYQSDSD